MRLEELQPTIEVSDDEMDCSSRASGSESGPSNQLLRMLQPMAEANSPHESADLASASRSSRSRSRTPPLRSPPPLAAVARSPVRVLAAARSPCSADRDGACSESPCDDFVFEEDDECEDFLPRGALCGAAAAAAASPPAAALVERLAPAKPRPLPQLLEAVVPEGNLSAPREVAAVDLLTEAQTEAVQLVVREARPKSKAAEEALQERLRRWGYGDGKLAEVLAYIRNEAPIIIHIDLASRLDKLEKDTHYRNQFETRCTSGSSDLTKRKSWEERLFPGIYSNVKAADRVKYGVLNAVNDPRGISTVATQYGKDYLVLRGVRLRTTFSDRDSCNKGQLASCEWYAHVLEKYSDLELKAVVEVALGESLSADSAVLDTAAGGYKEVQIHGELDFSKHLEVVVLHPSRRGGDSEKRIEKWCSSLGVRLEHMPPAASDLGSSGGGGSSCSTSTPKAVARGAAGGGTAGRRAKGGAAAGKEPWPLWRWHSRESSGCGLRFDAFSSMALEMRKRGGTAALPALPVGETSAVDLNEMTLEAKVGSEVVTVKLERCSAASPAAATKAAAKSRPSGRASARESASGTDATGAAGDTAPARSGGGRVGAAAASAAAAAMTAAAAASVSARLLVAGRPMPSGAAPARVVAALGTSSPAGGRAAPVGRWEWGASACGREGWRAYSLEHSVVLESAFSRGDSTAFLHIVGVHYTVNLQSMEQTNGATAYVRRLRRVPPSM